MPLHRALLMIIVPVYVTYLPKLRSIRYCKGQDFGIATCYAFTKLAGAIFFRPCSGICKSAGALALFVTERYVCTMANDNTHIFLRNRYIFYPIVSFDEKKDRLIELDFTSTNKELTNDIIENTEIFSGYIQSTLAATHARYGIGGYGEHRTVYSRSGVFDADKATEEPRRLHLGVDIWGPVGTPVHAPLGGMVKSFAFNNHFGDYGATIILLHQLEGIAFYTLYGHLSLKDLKNLSEGAYVIRGQVIGHFGPPEENGHWPPHVHMQIIYELGTAYGDYPGVCKFSEREKYLANCPDPDLIINMNRFISRQEVS